MYIDSMYVNMDVQTQSNFIINWNMLYKLITHRWMFECFYLLIVITVNENIFKFKYYI